MTVTYTNNISLITPGTGDLSGAWGTSAVNPNMVIIDAALCGTTTITLSSATTITLSTGTSPASVPYQSQNALIKFTGTLTGNCIINIPRSGFYIVDNQCTVGAFYVQLAAGNGTGNSIGAPPGQKVQVFYDGTHMDYVNLGVVGSALDLHGVKTLPAWINTACTVKPYLIKDGSTYNYSQYTALANFLGSTFGGNGVTTFAVPDEMNRVRLPVDTGTAARVTSLSGINGTTMGASGGNQLMQTHTHTITDPGHKHFARSVSVNNSPPISDVLVEDNGTGTKVVSTASTGITINNSGTGSSQNMPPTIVSFLPLIKC